jgi:hypothetical protein
MAHGGRAAPAPLLKIDRVVVATAVSWLGLWAHELHRVPRLFGLTLDGDLFMVPIAVALAIWWSQSHGTAAAGALAAYAGVNLAGAIVMVLPLGWLPFVPDQSIAHHTGPLCLCGVPAPVACTGHFATPASAGHKSSRLVGK